MNKVSKKRDKVFEYLDNQGLISVLNDFSMMPNEVQVKLQENFPGYPTYEQYKEITLNKNFNTFDDFVQDINNYIGTIPLLFPGPDIEYDDPLNHIKAAKCICEEILLNLNKYINLLKLDKNTLRGRYFKHVSDEYKTYIFQQRPDRYETEMLNENFEFNCKTKIFNSHSIPLKINPTGSI